jgi:hypothetical protein
MAAPPGASTDHCRSIGCRRRDQRPLLESRMYQGRRARPFCASRQIREGSGFRPNPSHAPMRRVRKEKPAGRLSIRRDASNHNASGYDEARDPEPWASGHEAQRQRPAHPHDQAKTSETLGLNGLIPDAKSIPSVRFCTAFSIPSLFQSSRILWSAVIPTRPKVMPAALPWTG